MRPFSDRQGRACNPGRRSLPRRVAAVFAVMAAIGFASPLRAGEGPVARPFKGSARGYITAQIPPNGLFLEMSGQATQLGHFTRIEYALLGDDGSVVGRIVFTAANGDQLWVEIDGEFISATDVAGRYIINGGTGRFQGATGEADFHAYTPDLHYAEVTFDGTVIY